MNSGTQNSVVPTNVKGPAPFLNSSQAARAQAQASQGPGGSPDDSEGWSPWEEEWGPFHQSLPEALPVAWPAAAVPPGLGSERGLKVAEAPKARGPPASFPPPHVDTGRGHLLKRRTAELARAF